MFTIVLSFSTHITSFVISLLLVLLSMISGELLTLSGPGETGSTGPGAPGAPGAGFSRFLPGPEM